MLRNFHADLHIHSCLSPCAEIEMTPKNIVDIALKKGLDIIAVTDHNSAENVEVTKEIAKGTGLTVFAGMEVTSSEEVHILALFENTYSALRMQDFVYKNLQAGENDERLYGHQLVVNEKDEIIGFNKRLLITATLLTAHSILGLISSVGGLSFASHIDREGFSVLSQLGFIPGDLRFDALEMSKNMNRDKAEERFKGLNMFPWVSFSDAHYPDDIGKRITTFNIKEPVFYEIRQALKNTNGRSLNWS